MDLFRYPLILGGKILENVAEMSKNDPQNRRFGAKYTLLIANFRRRRKIFQKMVCKSAIFNTIWAPKRLHTHINFFSLPKSGPFVRNGGGYGYPPYSPSLRPCTGDRGAGRDRQGEARPPWPVTFSYFDHTNGPKRPNFSI